MPIYHCFNALEDPRKISHKIFQVQKIQLYNDINYIVIYEGFKNYRIFDIPDIEDFRR